MAITTQERTNILKLTVGLFNAAPGANYLSEFTSVFEANGHNLGALANTLGTTGAFQSLYPNFQTASEFATKFLTTLGLQGKTEAVDFVTAKFNAGVPKAQIIFDALVALDASTSTEYADAKAILVNKAAVAENYSVTLAASSTSLATLQGAVANVTADAASVTAANAANAGGNGQTFTLTTNADAAGALAPAVNTKGTAGNDLYKGIIDAQTVGNTTLQAIDDIDGGAGTDTLQIISNGNLANAVTPLFLKNVEKVSVKDVDATLGTTVNLVNATGVTEVINDGSVAAVAFQNIGTAAVTVQNVKTAVGTTFSRGTTPVTADLTINLDTLGSAAAPGGVAAVQAGAVQSVDANNDATNVTINTKGYVSVGGLEVTGNAGAGHTAQTVTINAASTTIIGAAGVGADLIGFDTTKAGKIVVTGAGAVTLNDLAGAVKTVDASANTGGVTLVGTVYGGTEAAAQAAPGLNITGGAGNDNITVDGVATAVVSAGAGNDAVILTTAHAAGAKIDGGEGTDRIVLTSAMAAALDDQTAAGTALRATLTNFEQIGIAGTLAADFNVAQAGGYNYLALNGDVNNAGPVTVNGFTSGGTVEFRNAASQTAAINIGVTGAAESSTDVVNLKLNANLANGDNFTVRAGVTGVNNVNIDANDRVNNVQDDDQAAAGAKDNTPDDGYTVVLTNAANVNNIAITGTSAVSYSYQAGTDALKLVDASASTGNVTIDLTGFAGTERVEIKGSQGTNILTGSGVAFGEKITGGAKADIITGGAGADDMTGNGGRDAFVIGVADSGRTGATVDQISDFGKATVAVSAADVTAMGTVAAFQAAATARGGDNADILDLTGATVATSISSFTTNVLTGLEAVDATSTEFTGKEISLNIAKGVLTLGGADKGMVDTLAEWLVVANLAAETANEAVAFEFGGNTYVFQQVTPADVADDLLVELTGVTGVTGVVLAGGAVAAAVGDIFIV